MAPARRQVSQRGPYPHEIQFETRAELEHAVNALLSESHHQHNFEVWVDEGVIRVNQMGLDCLSRSAVTFTVSPSEDPR